MTLEVRRTRHGPLLDGIVDGLDMPIALHWNGSESPSMLAAVLQLDQASDWPSFRAALSHWTAAPQHFVYADTEGNIGYQLAGRVPRRTQNQGRVPLPGWTGAFEWHGEWPFEQLPHTLNPPSGYLVVADQPITGDAQPVWDGSPAAHRARRIEDLLLASDQHTPDSFRAIEADVYTPSAANLMPYLLALEPQGWLQERVYRDLLRNWDGQLAPHSGAGAVWQVFYQHLIEAILLDELGATLFHDYLNTLDVHQVVVSLLADAENPWFDDLTTPQREIRDDVLRRALAEAMDELGRHHGDLHTNWRWGDLHRLILIHQPLGQSDLPVLARLVNRGPYPLGGSPLTVDATSWRFAAPFDVIAGPSCRQIVELGNLDASLFQINSGQSGQPFHRHYADQVRPWIDVSPHPAAWSRQAVKAAHVALLVLQPH
ncbi:MAG: penicillin acylase family protein [Chloroflexota bacterium]